MLQHRYAYLLSITLLTASLTFMLACSQSGSSGVKTTEVSFGISDAPVGALRSVTIMIESLTVDREGNDDIVIETFDTDGGEVERIAIDLLDYQGSESAIIIDAFVLEVGDYQNIRLEILDEDTDLSYVLEVGSDERKLLKVPSGQLKLGGFQVDDGGPQTFILEFDLGRAMTHNPTPERYILKPRGVRVVDVEAAALVRGAAQNELLEDCDNQTPGNANSVYLYQGHNLTAANLGDAFDPEIDDDVPAETIEPFAVGTLDLDDGYAFAFVPAGDYTLAFSCDGAADDAELLDGIEIPSPEGQLVEFTLEPTDELVCNFELAGPDCL